MGIDEGCSKERLPSLLQSFHVALVWRSLLVILCLRFLQIKHFLRQDTSSSSAAKVSSKLFISLADGIVQKVWSWIDQTSKHKPEINENVDIPVCSRVVGSDFIYEAGQTASLFLPPLRKDYGRPLETLSANEFSPKCASLHYALCILLSLLSTLLTWLEGDKRRAGSFRLYIHCYDHHHKLVQQEEEGQMLTQ